jgi:hypothetical protein
MNSEFQAKLDAKIKEYRSWAHNKSVAVGRLVQYSGSEFLGAVDVAPEELEGQIVGLECEGFYVDWAEYNERIYLRVWEYPGPEPNWDLVFKEKDLMDVP